MASPFCFRPSPELGARIDAAAKKEGLSRAQWLAKAAELRLVLPPAAEVVEAAPIIAPPADGSARADAFRAASLRRLGR